MRRRQAGRQAGRQAVQQEDVHESKLKDRRPRNPDTHTERLPETRDMLLYPCITSHEVF
jgi:hypothetical protein